MKKRPNLVLREPVKLYENKGLKVENSKNEVVEKKEQNANVNQVIEIVTEKNSTKIEEKKEIIYSQKVSVKEKMSPRVLQIWNYFCKKAKQGNETINSFNLTRAEVMKEAGIGSTNTYRDALKKFQEMNLLEIELRPGVNSGSIFTFTEKGLEELD